MAHITIVRLMVQIWNKNSTPKGIGLKPLIEAIKN